MKMDLDDCVYYGGTQGNRLWGRYAKRVYQVEKEIFSSGCIENIDFAQRVLKQLGSDGRRYLLECDYLDFYEKSSVAKAFCIDLPFSLEKPNGNTVYEYSSSGTMFPRTRGFLLFENGRLYKFDGKSELIAGQDSYRLKYELIVNNQDLSLEVKQFILDNQNAINVLPSKADCKVFHDGAYIHYKFQDKSCDGYMIDYAENGKEAAKWAQKVESIFKKYGIILKPSFEESLIATIRKYQGIFDEIDLDNSFEKGYDFLDSTEFGDSCGRFGFDILEGDMRRFIDNVGPCSFDELEDKQFLGSIIRSVWTYHKNAQNKSVATFKTDWFRWAFAQLEKILEKDVL